MINIQPIEKVHHAEDYSVEVHSIFYTIQGEGPLSGHPAVFIRLAGCNLQCPMCDTEYTSKRKRMSPEAIVAQVAKLHPGPRLVVITGGEPFRQDLGLLTHLLDDQGYQVQIETNGTLPPPPGVVWNTMIVVSPKTGKVHPATVERANAYKYVLDIDHIDPDDGLPTLALGHTAHPRVARPPKDFPIGAVYVQPCDQGSGFALDGPNHRNMKAVIDTCMKHGYTAQLQLHKYLGLE